ncbi:hypothetical protein ACLD43_11265 [Clostridium botulinum]|uniref:hypothetical protein n=1 Tax=Clostridium botulinum TaxID=1491 RepID=UPI003A7F7981
MDCIILDCAKVRIGDDGLFGFNVGFYPVNYAIDAEERAKGGCIASPVHIGNRVWLGRDVKVLAAASIGDNIIIGTGSIVMKSIPSEVIAAGNPRRTIRDINESDKTHYFVDLKGGIGYENEI